jgi:hypothetical protein
MEDGRGPDKTPGFLALKTASVSSSLFCAIASRAKGQGTLRALNVIETEKQPIEEIKTLYTDIVNN